MQSNLAMCGVTLPVKAHAHKHVQQRYAPQWFRMTAESSQSLLIANARATMQIKQQIEVENGQAGINA